MRGGDKGEECEDGEMVILANADLASLPVEQTYESEVTEFARLARRTR